MERIQITVATRSGRQIPTTWLNGPEHSAREEAARRAFFAGVFQNGGRLVSIDKTA